MDDIRNSYANVVNVTGTREEIDIRFGKTLENPYFKERLQVQATNRITLSPFVAKKLAMLLYTHMKEYEEKYGPLGKPASDKSEEIELSIDLLPSRFRTLRTEKEAGLLLGLIKSLDIVVGFERSIKLFPGVVLANRFLAGFKRHDNEGVLDNKILEICETINMPPEFFRAFQDGLPEANIVLFGFEEHEHNCVYKAYLEFGNRFSEIFQETHGQMEPFIIHMGYKWDTRDNSRNAVAQYRCFPGISVNAIVERLSDSFYGSEKKELLEITSRIIHMALRKIDPYEILYLEVQEENNPRRSFDINIYRANLTMETLYPLLLRMSNYFAIPSELFHDLYGPVKNQLFGHISGGIDREGRDFLTFYFGVKGSSRAH